MSWWETIEGWKASGQKIVFANGCFDCLHPGHIYFLDRAEALGDRLVVGLNSDASVRRLKGNGRPILNQELRKMMLAPYCDLVCIFDDSTPLELIKAIEPDVLAVGRGYSLRGAIGAKEVKKSRGKVVHIEYDLGYSTTRILNGEVGELQRTS